MMIVMVSYKEEKQNPFSKLVEETKQIIRSTIKLPIEMIKIEHLEINVTFTSHKEIKFPASCESQHYSSAPPRDS